MALNHNTDMLYTRSGAAESNVLSAHDPLIWEFEDTALVGGSATATVQFIAKDNDLAVIYTSAAFPAYQLSYVDPLAKFRFDGTQILKHIIKNYLYKEISTIIAPENYGSTVDVVFRTYDNAVENANDTVTYYLSQAVNQIGDEYGSNIPRLFLNDTEDIAHFLGYPTKIFFYLATDRSAHSPLIEIIDRDITVEDASDHGSMKIGIHCIDLGLLALSKKSKYARMYYDSYLQFIHDCATKGNPSNVIANDTFTPIAYYYNKKTYQVWMQRDIAGYDSRAMVWAYYHETNTESADYDLHTASQPTGDTDDHAIPTVIVADDGHIVVVHEFKRVAPATHNDALVILRSDNAEDETSWVNAKAENANYYTTVGDSATIRLAYPNLLKDNNGYLYIICRRYTAGGRYTRIFKSTDNGISWNAGYDITDSGNDTLWHYPTGVRVGTNNTLRFVIRFNDNAAGTLTKVYYLESDDEGVTWKDVSGSHSQNIVTGGAISQATLDNAAYDYKVVVAADVGHDEIYPRSGTIGDNNIPYICTLEFDDPPVDWGYRMFWWTGSAWTNSMIKDNVGIAGGGCLIHKGGDEFDCYMIELDGADNNLDLYRTTNLTTWSKTRTVKDTSGLTAYTFSRTHFTFNYKDADYWLFIAHYGTHADYADLFIEVQHYVKIKDYNLNIFEACENAIFIRWLNSNGDYSYWAFSPYPFRNKSGDRLGSVINNFTEMALANSRNLPLGYRDAFDKISVIASAVPLLFRRKMLEIFTSPAVYLWNGIPSENLISGFTNSGYETLITNGTIIISAINTVDNGGTLSNIYSVTQAEQILVMFDFNLNSGALPTVGIVDKDATVFISNNPTVTEGWNFITLTVTANSEARLFIRNLAASTNWSTSEIIVKRKEKESDWILLNRVEGSHNLMLKKDNDNFECTLVLPENYTQQLSGQNI